MCVGVGVVVVLAVAATVTAVVFRVPELEFYH